MYTCAVLCTLTMRLDYFNGSYEETWKRASVRDEVWSNSNGNCETLSEYKWEVYFTETP